MELDVDLGAGLGEREETGTEAQHQIVRFKECAAKVGENVFQVLETHVFANPQAFALVKHGRMGGVAVHPVGAPGCNHADFRHSGAVVDRSTVAFHMLHRVANLHRAGVRAQQIGRFFTAAFDVKGVVHRASGMVFRRIQCREVEPVGLNFGALGHLKAHGAKDRLNALQRQTHRMQTSLTALTTRQRHIQRLGLQLDFQLGVGKGLAPRCQRRLNGLLRLVDRRSAALFFIHRQSRHALHQLGDATRFAQKLGLGVFQIGRGGGLREAGASVVDQCVQLVHVCACALRKQKRG